MIKTISIESNKLKKFLNNIDNDFIENKEKKITQ